MTQIQREIPFGRPWLDDEDRQAVMEILNGHVLTHGPKGKEFETKFQHFVGGGYAVTTSSCMASLHLSAIHIGLKPGDEVIVPAQTHVATVHAVELLGATPIFVDCELETGNMNISLIESKITPKTKAIFIVHFAGIPMEMDKVCQIAEKHKLKVIEDCALAVGGYYKNKHVGLWGDMGCFSFYPVKHMTTAEGGMLISKVEKTAKDIAHFRAFSVDRTYSERKTPGVYDVNGVGLNYRLSELQAALGCTQINKLPENLRRRKKNFDTLKELLLKGGSVRVLDASHSDVQNSHYCLVAVLDKNIRHKRDGIIQYLTDHKAGCSVYYPHPVPRMAYYQQKYHPNLKEYPNATAISDGSIALPVGPHLDLEDMHLLATLFKQAIS
ncbi:MAG: DegT/DnrJ/EryC1/StrS family aminotransferase [Alphaproteobacteria bacterium]|nr:DegT/DnrJ/EryC1/StrS family aminotransferase [Alphaproteobacteria bacterium]